MKIAEVASALGAKWAGPEADVVDFSIDSRTVTAGSVFFAIKGERFDGHDFVDQLPASCIAAVVSRPVESSVPLILVPDVLQAMTQLAAYRRQHFLHPVVAITGSCGKTTTRSLLKGVLAEKAPVLASVKSFNNHVGVPLTLLGLNESYQYAVIEAGTSSPGEIRQHSELIQPDISVILLAREAHTAGLGGLAGVIAEKGDLVVGLKPSGTLVINRDEPTYETWTARVTPSQTVCSFGLHQDADVRAENITTEASGLMSFDLVMGDKRGRAHLPLMGEHNVMNALAAVAVAQVLQIDFQSIIKGLSNGEFEAGRLLQKVGCNDAKVIDDAYNANPASVRAAIAVLVGFSSAQKVLVLGDMLELGDAGPDIHHTIGEEAKKAGIDHLFGFGELSRQAVTGFGDQGRHWEDKQALIAQLKKMANANMVILVKGSNSMGMNQVVKALCPKTEEV